MADFQFYFALKSREKNILRHHHHHLTIHVNKVKKNEIYGKFQVYIYIETKQNLLIKSNYVPRDFKELKFL